MMLRDVVSCHLTNCDVCCDTADPIPVLVAEVRRLRAFEWACKDAGFQLGKRYELAWKPEPPTKPGWYWWRRKAGMKAELIHVGADQTAHIATGPWAGEPAPFMCNMGGQWAGPLEPPP